MSREECRVIESTDPLALGSSFTNLCNPSNPPESPFTDVSSLSTTQGYRLERWALQSAAREILQGERVSICLRRPRSNAAAVTVLESPRRKSFHYGNLVVCGSVWTCPICATRITERRQSEVVKGISRWHSQGGGVLLLTLTVPHYASQSLHFVMDRISDARRRLLNRKPWKRLMSVVRQVGEIRVAEVKYASNGWHPHFHILLFTRRKVPNNELRILKHSILEQWKSACKSAGLPRPNSHGVALSSGNKAAMYVAKWALDHKTKKGNVNNGQHDTRTPFDLLHWYLTDKSSDAAARFTEYAMEFKGRNQLKWSAGLRDLLQISREKSDVELARDINENATTLFAEIPLNVWRIVLREDKRGELLEVCRSGDDALMNWLTDLCDKHGMVDS